MKKKQKNGLIVAICVLLSVLGIAILCALSFNDCEKEDSSSKTSVRQDDGWTPNY